MIMKKVEKKVLKRKSVEGTIYKSNVEELINENDSINPESKTGLIQLINKEFKESFFIKSDFKPAYYTTAETPDLLKALNYETHSGNIVVFYKRTFKKALEDKLITDNNYKSLIDNVRGIVFPK